MYSGAIVGCGAVACEAHVPAWQANAACRIVAAVDPLPAHRARLQALLPGVRCYDRLDTLLERESVDFLDICTPPALHEAGILQACARGVHVLCEKPLTFTAEAMQRIMAAARAAKTVVFPVHNWKYAPIFQRLKQLLNEGRIGTPVEVELTTLRTQPAGNTGWRLDPHLAGGGILLDHGWHALYLLLFLLEAAPQTIAASLEKRLFLSAGVEDTVTCEVTFAQARARFHLTWAAAQRSNLGLVRGSLGDIRLADAHLELRGVGQEPETIAFPEALSAGSYHPAWLTALLPDFYAELRDPHQRGRGLREAELCLRLTLLAYRSAAQDAQPLACTQSLDLK
ncbi:MAG: Gfo/Idh/MocA family protein [Candidatus Tectimicrobiota bacterium]